MEKLKKTKRNLSMNSEKLTCNFCNHEYTKSHTCEKKKRFENRDTKISKLAYRQWLLVQCNEFYNTHDHFESSFYYLTFIKFATYCIKENYLEPFLFAKWLLQNKFPLQKWENPEVYIQFVKSYLHTEHPKLAVERSIKYITKILKCDGNFFSEFSINKILLLLETGKISPWLILLYEHNEDFFNRFDSYQLEQFQKMVNIDSWNLRIKRNLRNVTNIKKDLSGAKI